jgi:hypothetical protein
MSWINSNRILSVQSNEIVLPFGDDEHALYVQGPRGEPGPVGMFGQFTINTDGELILQYFGDDYTNQFTIDSNGNLIVSV